MVADVTKMSYYWCFRAHFQRFREFSFLLCTDVPFISSKSSKQYKVEVVFSNDINMGYHTTVLLRHLSVFAE